LALLNNKIIDTTNQLQNLTKGTDEYNIVLHSLMSSVDSYNEKMQAIEDRATEEVKQALLRQQAVANYNYEQKLATQTIQQQEVEMQKYIQQTSNVAQSVEYWKKRVDDIKVAISDQTAKLKDAEQTY
jgi:chromosome segregation ATPase